MVMVVVVLMVVVAMMFEMLVVMVVVVMLVVMVVMVVVVGIAGAQSSEEDEGAHEPLPIRRARADATPRVIREEVEGGIWGKYFRIVKSRKHGEYVAWTVTCNFHKLEGRCNQNLSFREVGSADEARQRLKEWCLRGLRIPDEAGAKKAHMDSKAKMYPLSGVRSEEELDRIANTIA